MAAFEELVHRYEDRVYGFVAHWCGKSADAREVTQDTFVRAFQAIDRFDCRRGFAPWLFTIARRKCIDRHRAALSAAAALMPEGPDDNDPAELLARQEERRGLWELARRCLPETQFQSLWLRYVEELSVAGIAQVLRKTQTHVKVLLFRARTALGRELKAAEMPAAVAKIAVPHALPERQAGISPYERERGGLREGCAAGLSATVVSPQAQCARKGAI